MGDKIKLILVTHYLILKIIEILIFKTYSFKDKPKKTFNQW